MTSAFLSSLGLNEKALQRDRDHYECVFHYFLTLPLFVRIIFGWEPTETDQNVSTYSPCSSGRRSHLCSAAGELYTTHGAPSLPNASFCRHNWLHRRQRSRWDCQGRAYSTYILSATTRGNKIALSHCVLVLARSTVKLPIS